ncbi:hypothetical protein GGGNBK_00870 [Sporosarcina sp. ANT_H38]
MLFILRLEQYFIQRRAEGTESGVAHDRRVEKSIAEKLLNKKSSMGTRL